MFSLFENSTNGNKSRNGTLVNLMDLFTKVRPVLNTQVLRRKECLLKIYSLYNRNFWNKIILTILGVSGTSLSLSVVFIYLLKYFCFSYQWIRFTYLTTCLPTHLPTHLSVFNLCKISSININFFHPNFWKVFSISRSLLIETSFSSS